MKMVNFSSTLPTMDLRKLTFSDQLISSPRRKIVSRFGLGIVLSFIAFSVVLGNMSFKIPFLDPVFNGLSSFGNSSSFSWPFSSGFASISNITGNCNGNCNDTSDVNNLGNPVSVTDVAGRNKSLDLVNSGGKDAAFVGNSSEKSKIGVGMGELNIGVSSPSLKNERNSSVENGSMKNSTVGSVEGLRNGSVGNYSSNGDDGYSNVGGIKDPVAHKSLYECDIFKGRWVRDDTKPLYPASSCPYIDRDFDCHLNGRPDSEYVKWRWQPFDCEIPRFNTTDFLERLRGKKVVFVGDSLNRNMWESLVCVLRQGVEDKKKVYEISGRHEFKKKGFYAFLFEDFNCTIDFVSSPFLVKESTFNGKNGSIETLRLDLMDGTISMYHDADVIIFNTGHWWTHEKTSRGEDYYQEGNVIHKRLKVMEAYKRALVTWGRWVDKNIDSSKTQVIFRGYSVTHFRGGPWNAGGQCHKETEPIYNEAYITKYPSKMKLLEYVLKDMKTPVTYLNISRLTDYRKDGHPSIYRPDNNQDLQAQDCSHWCLPGVPDTWNELLYASLLQTRRGLWGN